MAYLTVKSISAEDSLKGKIIKAKLEGNGSAKITMTIKAEKKEDIKEILGTLKKGAVFRIHLEQIGTLDFGDFSIFEEFKEG